ncbi:MAG TPA: hypothetical protein VF781_01875 [Solirubrobacteraceae bacterium]
MADHVLHIAWDRPVPGREERGLEVFNEALGLYGRMQQDGRIESFDVVLFDPNGGANGYIELRGTSEQLAAMRDDETFRRTTVDASLIVENLRLIDGVCNEGIAREMALYQDALTKVTQEA